MIYVIEGKIINTSIAEMKTTLEYLVTNHQVLNPDNGFSVSGNGDNFQTSYTFRVDTINELITKIQAILEQPGNHSFNYFISK